MLTDSEENKLFAKYGFLYDAIAEVRAGKRFSAVEKAALKDRCMSMIHEVLAKQTKGCLGEVLAIFMLMEEVLSPDGPREEIEKVTVATKVKLRYGFEAATLWFEEPPHEQWRKQNSEYLVGFPTGLIAPFDKVFVKRIVGSRTCGHDLLMKITGQPLPFSPAFFGYFESESGNYVYFFENLAPGFNTLESELTSSALICPRIINSIVRKAAVLMRTIYQFGFVYTDFCTKNIMIEQKTQAISIIDIDSCIPAEMLLQPEKLKAQGQEEFWGLWNQHLNKTQPARMENAQKSVVFSFAALWCRALTLKYRSGDAGLSALKLVHNPSYEAQRPLWEALIARKRQGFFDYFTLSENASLPIYNQWQGLFDAFRTGSNIRWQEIVSATQNMLTAIEDRRQASLSPVYSFHISFP